MHEAGLAYSWHDEHELSEAQDLADDLDDILETDINSLADSKYVGSSTLSVTLLGAYTGATDVRMRKKSQYVFSYYDDTLTHPKLGKATATATSSDPARTAQARSTNLEIHPRHIQPTKADTPHSPTPPQAEQQRSPDTSHITPPPNGGHSSSSLRSFCNHKTRYCKSMFIWYLLVIMIITAQMFSASEWTRIKVTERPAKSACTSDNEVFASLLEYLLGVLHNIAPLALLIANVVGKRDRAMSKGYLRWFASMLIVFFGIITVSIVLRVQGKWEYAMLFIGISDSWVVAITFFLFDYVLHPLNSHDGVDPGDGA
jgi:hypothetical protein